MALQVSPPHLTLLGSCIVKMRLNHTKPSIHFELTNSALQGDMVTSV